MERRLEMKNFQPFCFVRIDIAMNQSTSSVFMIRPLHFGFNEQTAASNSFQKNVLQEGLLKKVQQEFDEVVKLLKQNEIEVFVFEDRADVITPDSIFPNNWISIQNKTITLYPMLADNRKAERRNDVIDFFKKENINVFDLTTFENENKFLEGTGSLVLDHLNKIAYAALSPRTNLQVLNQWCSELNYKPITFTALDELQKPIYHTNVMLSIGTGYTVLASDTIANENERKTVESSLTSTHHELINITNEQINNFAGNMLELENKSGKKFVVMSETAYKILSLAQIEKINKYAAPIVCSIPLIEATGGGSIRCMIAEVF